MEKKQNRNTELTHTDHPGKSKDGGCGEESCAGQAGESIRPDQDVARNHPGCSGKSDLERRCTYRGPDRRHTGGQKYIVVHPPVSSHSHRFSHCGISTLPAPGSNPHAQYPVKERPGWKWKHLPASLWHLLTIYDMCKAIDRQMVIENIRLIKKEKRDLSS